VIWVDATGATIPIVDYYTDSSGAVLLVVIDRSTGYVWQATPTSGTVFPGYPGSELSTALDFQYTAAGCAGSPVFSFGAAANTPPALYTFLGSDGTYYALGDTAGVSSPITLLGSKTSTSSTTCTAEDVVGTSGVLVSSCNVVGTAVPTSLFTPPAHPEIVP
jgi:hypothetical protein